MRTTERHFQEQVMVQSDLKRQLRILEQSKLQQEVSILSPSPNIVMLRYCRLSDSQCHLQRLSPDSHGY